MATSELMSPMQEPTPPDNSSRHEDELGARSGRAKAAAIHDDPLDDGDDNNSSNTEEGPNRKRRRSRKGLDKKFECPHEGCGKSYSRAEHLYVTQAMTGGQN